jgi:predicted ATPase
VEALVSRSRQTTVLVMLKELASNASGQALCEMVSPIIVRRRGATAAVQAG